jgi:DNA repair exonuclease SbcCD ATPase subunit
MILKKCTIDNFGKFSNKEFTYKNGLNSFDEENGWGKTTLAAFIKAMFYGMTESRSKSLFMEREKYMPWQGGIYGGTLIFSYKDTDYKIVRSFGAKKKDDTFKLYDVKTGKESNAYTENLGEDLFNVNLETFERSIFVTLDESRKPQGSTDITAKLSDLIEDTSDISNYDIAHDKLEKLGTDLKAKRGSGGSIAKVTAIIDHDNNQLIDIGSKEQSVGIYQERITDEKAEVEKENQKLTELHELFSVSEKYARKQNYDQMKEQQQAVAVKEEQLLAFFQGKVPDTDTLETVSQNSDDFTKYANFLKKDSVTETDRTDYQTLLNFFKGDVPSAEAVADCQRVCASYDTLKQQINEQKLSAGEMEELSALKKKFDGTTVSREIIDKYLSDYETVQELKNKISEVENNRSVAQSELELLKQQKPKNIKRVVFLSIAALSAVAGGILITKNMTTGIAGFGTAVLFIILGIIQKNARQDFTGQEKKLADFKEEAAEKERKSRTLEEGYRNFIIEMGYGSPDSSVTVALSDIKNSFSRYTTLKGKEDSYLTWIEKQKIQPEQYEKDIRAFEIRYGQKDDVTMISSILETVRNKVTKLTELKKRINEYDVNKQNLAECEEKLKQCLSLFKTDTTASYERQVQEIRDRKHDYDGVISDVKDIQEKIAAFESQNDVSLLKDVGKPEKDAEELKAELKKVQDEINLHLSSIAGNQKNIDDLTSDIDRRQELENELEQCNADKEIQEKQYDIFTKTMEYLEEAKEKLDSNYMDPMKSGFDKYMKMLDQTAIFEINSDLTVSVENNGKPYDSKYLSEGYKDLVNFCSRMALVDALFKDEKPVVILDDPFVNFDEEKLGRAVKLIQQMANEKQILYFVCHNSRNIPTAG